ncbi:MULTISPECIES: ABC transporter permease [Clostridia]|uniref:ABC transporter permease n=1 Tax=Clostridia TaxID=186801 RepID=UPI000EA2A625|nr:MULTISPECIES: ABC transporter permease [Clostridia]NBJ69663.1 ABC transporter permease [Roseburia sp. 1XD42-34]RKI78284.1 ABC transporter permease [Clostridium sp. 1xD42-85]
MQQTNQSEKQVVFPEEMFKVVGRKEEESEKISKPVLSNWQDGWLRLKKNKAAIVGLFIILTIVLLSFVGPYVNEYAYDEAHYDKVYSQPNNEHWLGTDKFGRDQWTRLWEGTKVSLYIAVLAALLDILIGITYGAVSAWKGGKVDNIMQRIIEILVGIPNLIIIILLIMIMKPGIITIMLAMVITGWVNMARLVRGQVYKLKTQEYVLASRALGASTSRIILGHMLPNTLGIIIINLMFTIPSAIFTEAFLSFIGLGLQEPLASLGVLINDGFHSMRNQFYLLAYPAIVIVALMVSFNMLADGLRDAFDPKMRK